MPVNHDLSSLLEQISEHLDAGEDQQVLTILRDQGRNLVAAGFAADLLPLLTRVAQGMASIGPRLPLLLGETLLALGRLDEALDALMEARTGLQKEEDAAAELGCCLALARLYHRKEALSTARLYTEEALQLLLRHQDLPPRVRADVTMGLARLSPDIGRLGQSLRLAQESLQLYREARDQSGQLDATVLIALSARQLGRYQLADSHLEAAWQLVRRAPNPDPAMLCLLSNTAAHSAWYRADLVGAQAHIEAALEIAAESDLPRLQVYSLLVLGNVLRGAGRFDEAGAAYDRCESAAGRHGLGGFGIWIEVNRAWLNVLQKRFRRARGRLLEALQHADQGQAASFNVFLGGLYSLSERFDDSEHLFNDSLHYYQTSGDELSIFALHMHLAYVYLRSERFERADEAISLAFDWAARWNVDYFPHWWHPHIVATVCARALALGIHAGIAERILVVRIGSTAIPHLRSYLEDPSPAVRRRIADALSLLDRDALGTGRRADGEPVEAVLRGLLADRVLLDESLAYLAARLAMKPGARNANPTLLATFGLYLSGENRRSIAEKLGRSEKTIRNYITVIYDRFGLASMRGSTLERRRRLVELARAEKLIGPDVGEV